MITSRLDNTIITTALNPDAKYGFMLSGGLDSAVLLYLLLTYNKKLNIQLFTIKKHDGSHQWLNNIIQFMKDKTLIDLDDPIFVGDPNVHHDQQSNIAIQEINEKYKDVDYIIFGTNSNPPDSIHLPGVYPRRTRNFNPKIITPFKILYKTHIVDFVFEYGIEQLLEITHSCTEQVIGRCGKCFQCHERSWAFEELGQTDIGIN